MNGNSFFQSVLPSEAFRQSTTNRDCLSSAVVMKTLSPHTTGDECPSPGNAIFQLKSDSVHCVGMVFTSLMPLPFGPRNRVHSCARLRRAGATHRATAKYRHVIVLILIVRLIYQS